MDMEHKEINALKNEIKAELKLIYNANMKASGWDIPERDDKEMSNLILQTMQKALDELKEELKK